MRACLPILVLATGLLHGAETAWLDRVRPVMTASERKAYLALPPSERTRFEETFFERKAITAAEYYQRLHYIDDTFGSGKVGSGSNTDPGRVYLSLGAPAKISRIPSSRIFVPMEIWYYNDVPGILNTELRLIFYRKNNVGFLRLYSPTVDTVRALLLPQAGTINMFGPNDSVTESDIRKILTTGPAEDEIVTAASGVASGIKYSGNDQILGQIASPEFMLGKARPVLVTSRLVTQRPDLDILATPSPIGGTQIDLRLRTKVERELDLEVRDSATTIADNRVHLNLPSAQAIDYTHRLDLLPGSYRLTFMVDGKPAIYPLEIPVQPAMSEILRADIVTRTGSRHTPFEFDQSLITPNPDGRFAAVSLPHPGSVTWIVRQGSTAVWKSTVQADRLATVELPANLSLGAYRLEANAATGSRSADILLGKTEESRPMATALSYNANLAPAQRLAFLGHQYLLRGKLPEARRVLNASLESGGPSIEAQVELARADALNGDLDGARASIRKILANQPDNFEALAVYAYIETRFQDYPVAAELYRRALAIQDSPALRAALNKIEPSQTAP
jgi:GWxTD domain-containing protein